MKYISFGFIVFISVYALFTVGCSSKNNNASETEGIEEVSDGDAEINADADEEAEELVEEGILEEEISNEMFDEELPDSEEAFNEEEVQNEVIVETEQNESEQAEPAKIAIQKLPWDGVQVAPCGENADSVKQSRAVWGNKSGKVYFGGPEFWVLIENGSGGTLKCDPRVKGVFSMDGKSANGANELWLGLNGQIARYLNDEWTVYDIPAEVATGDVIDVDIAGDFISALTADSLALYNATDGTWHKVTNCPDDLNRMYGLAYDGQTLWASAGVKLYVINISTAACEEKKTVIETDAQIYEIGILGARNDFVWIVKMHHFATIIGGNCLTIYSYNNDLLNGYDIASHESAFSSVLSPGLGEFALIQFNLYSSSYISMYCHGPDNMAYDISFDIQVTQTDRTIEALSDNLPIDGGCMINSGDANKLILYQMDIQKSKSWRNGNIMWHLYGGPTKYSY